MFLVIQKTNSVIPGGETNIKINMSTLISGTYVIRAYNGKSGLTRKL